MTKVRNKLKQLNIRRHHRRELKNKILSVQKDKTASHDNLVIYLTICNRGTTKR